MKVYDRFSKENGEPKTLADIGTYLHLIKEAEPRFTGRAIKNVTDAIKMRAMDIELPDDWFETPETFMHKGYDEKKAMIEELRGPVLDGHGDAGDQPLRRFRIPLLRPLRRRRGGQDAARRAAARTGSSRDGGDEDEGAVECVSAALSASARRIGRQAWLQPCSWTSCATTN